MRGYIYALSNAAFPDLLKIGHTTNLPESRIRQLNTTGVPRAFTLEFCFLVHHAAQIEHSIHQALEKFRYAENREFFALSVSEALRITVSIVQAAYEHHPSVAVVPSPPAHNLSKDEVLILQMLVSAGSAQGVAQWRLREDSGLKELDLEIHLASLIAKKLVAREKGGAYGPSWRSTPKGIKFLSDHQLVEPWMYG